MAYKNQAGNSSLAVVTADFGTLLIENDGTPTETAVFDKVLGNSFLSHFPVLLASFLVH